MIMPQAHHRQGSTNTKIIDFVFWRQTLLDPVCQDPNGKVKRRAIYASQTTDTGAANLNQPCDRGRANGMDLIGMPFDQNLIIADESRISIQARRMLQKRKGKTCLSASGRPS